MLDACVGRSGRWAVEWRPICAELKAGQINVYMLESMSLVITFQCYLCILQNGMGEYMVLRVLVVTSRSSN